MSSIDVLSRTQRVVVNSTQRIIVTEKVVEVVNSHNAVIVAAGPQGVAGIQGPPGPSGGSATGVQDTETLVWIINHNKDFYPAAVKFFSEDGSYELEPESITYVNTNRILATWPEPIAGTWMVS